jgi:hypothetical protein
MGLAGPAVLTGLGEHSLRHAEREGGGDRHGVELRASAGREPLPERVGASVDHHARKGGIDHDGQRFAGVGPHRPHGETVGDQDADGEALTAVSTWPCPSLASGRAGS